ncbi:hypothetical protein EJB05_09788, partial [Eragrostis curvula]
FLFWLRPPVRSLERSARAVDVYKTAPTYMGNAPLEPLGVHPAQSTNLARVACVSLGRSPARGFLDRRSPVTPICRSFCRNKGVVLTSELDSLTKRFALFFLRNVQ